MRWLVTGIAALMAAAFVGSGRGGRLLYWQRVETRGEQAARDELGPLAQKQIPTVFTYDYKTVERSLSDAYHLLTPDYRREFEDRANSDIIPQARQREVVSQANVVGVGVHGRAAQFGSGDGVHQPHGVRQVESRPADL